MDKKIKTLIEKNRPGPRKFATYTYKENGDKAELVYLIKEQIKNELDLIKAAKIDTNIWEVEKWTCNKWESASKYRDQDLDWKISKDGEQLMSGSAVRKNEYIHTELWSVRVWLKKNKPLIEFNNIKEAIIQEIKKSSKKVPKIKIQKYTKPCLLVMDIPDLHFDKLAWGKETGKDWDTKISSSALMRTVEDIISKSSGFNAEKILYVVGNDLFNADNLENTTTAGTKQIVDGRWKKAFPMARKLMVSVIERLATIAPVDVLVVTGNHDTQKSFYLGDALECWFHNNPNVNINNSPRNRKYYLYGKTLIGYAHGKEEKIDRLPMIMANEEKASFAKTEYHEWHLGDKHHKKDIKFTPAEEVDGTIIRFLSSLTALDQWHYDKGYISKQAGQGFIYDKENGWICQFNSFYNN